MPAEDNAIRPFRVSFPEAELTGLRRRVAATRWPERETVSDDSQGAPLAMMQEHARMARLGHRAAEDHRPAHQPDGARRDRCGRVPPGDSLAAGARVLG